MMKAINTAILAALTLSATAQGLEDNTLKVEKEYQTELYAAKPLVLPYSMDPVEKSTQQIDADTLMSMGAYHPDLSLDISPVAYDEQVDRPYHHLHMALHKGTLNTWNGDATAIYRSENYYTVGGRFYMDDWAESGTEHKYTKQRLGQFAAKYYISPRLLTEVHLQHSTQNLGLYVDVPNPSVSAQSMRLDMSSGKISFESFDRSVSALAYSLSTQYHITTHRLDQSITEKYWVIQAGLSKAFDNTWSVGIDSKLDLIRYMGTSRDLVNNTAYLRYNGASFTTKIGATHNVHLSHKKSIYPYLRLQWYPTSYTIISADVIETYTTNGLTSTLVANPYLDLSSLTQLAVGSRRTHGLSVETSIIDDLTLTTAARYDRLSNAQNWQLATKKLLHTTAVDYDAVIADLSASYQLTSTLSTGLGARYTHFMTEAILYHRPTWSVSPSIRLAALDSRLTAELTGTINGKQNIAMANDQVIASGIRHDVSLSVTYRPHRNVSVYLNGDNLLNDDYEMLGGYSVFGRNLSAGVLLKL